MRAKLGLFALLAFAAVACGDSTSSSTDLCAGSGAAATVRAADNYTFTPASATIAAGQSVCWQNTGNLNHTVTQTVNPGQIPLFNGNLPGGQTVVIPINVAGTWAYHCTQHPNMTAPVIVNP